MLCKNAILYSNKNLIISEKINKYCKTRKINLLFAMDLPTLTYQYVELKPEIIFYDLDTINMEKKLFQGFIENEYFKNVNIIFISENKLNVSLDREYQNVHIVNNEDYITNLDNVISNIDIRQRHRFSEEEIKEYKIKISALLRELGITTKHMGYNYLREIVLEIIKDDRKEISLTQHVYPKIAILFNTYTSNVERNIRNALSFTIKNCRNIKMMEEIKTLNNTVPSNKQFITYLVDKLTEEI